jgi:hypothetical protein
MLASPEDFLLVQVANRIAAILFGFNFQLSDVVAEVALSRAC